MSELFIEPKIELNIKPFVRWAGGKNWVLGTLKNFLPDKFNNYHEPFLGGGSVFFSIKPRNISFLSDLNNELINAFIQIKENPITLIKHLDTFLNTENNYYKVRSNINGDPVVNAARFIFLNKTCYNGIYRVNSKGRFNVPYGHNQNVTIYEKNNLIAINKILQRSQITAHDFEISLINIQKDDLVFLDPPYTVTHTKNGFLEYNQKIFSWEDQERLADFVNNINKKGAYFILTNAVHENIVTLYKNLGKRFEIERYSTITSQIEKRRRISEYLFSNCI